MLTLRRKYHEGCTTGVIILPNGDEIFTLERPWLNNKSNVSCIPEGVYIIDRDVTGRWQYYRVRDEQVAPRFAIELHPANYVQQLAGCIAPCMKLKQIGDEEYMGVDSKKALLKIMKYFGDESWVLKITH